jgi:hypothetical protein
VPFVEITRDVSALLGDVAVPAIKDRLRCSKCGARLNETRLIERNIGQRGSYSMSEIDWDTQCELHVRYGDGFDKTTDEPETTGGSTIGKIMVAAAVHYAIKLSPEHFTRTDIQCFKDPGIGKTLLSFEDIDALYKRPDFPPDAWSARTGPALASPASASEDQVWRSSRQCPAANVVARRMAAPLNRRELVLDMAGSSSKCRG